MKPSGSLLWQVPRSVIWTAQFWQFLQTARAYTMLTLVAAGHQQLSSGRKPLPLPKVGIWVQIQAPFDLQGLYYKAVQQLHNTIPNYIYSVVVFAKGALTIFVCEKNDCQDLRQACSTAANTFVFQELGVLFFPPQCPVITEMRAFGPWLPLVDLACPATRVACKMHSQLSKPHVRMNSLQQPTVPCTILNRFLMFETPALKPVQVIPKLSMLGVSWTMLITRIMFVRQEDRKQSLHAKPSDPRNKSNLETLETSTPIQTQLMLRTNVAIVEAELGERGLCLEAMR